MSSGCMKSSRFTSFTLRRSQTPCRPTPHSVSQPTNSRYLLAGSAQLVDSDLTAAEPRDGEPCKLRRDRPGRRVGNQPAHGVTLPQPVDRRHAGVGEDGVVDSQALREGRRYAHPLSLAAVSPALQQRAPATKSAHPERYSRARWPFSPGDAVPVGCDHGIVGRVLVDPGHSDGSSRADPEALHLRGRWCPLGWRGHQRPLRWRAGDNGDAITVEAVNRPLRRSSQDQRCQSQGRAPSTQTREFATRQRPSKKAPSNSNAYNSKWRTNRSQHHCEVFYVSKRSWRQ